MPQPLIYYVGLPGIDEVKLIPGLIFLIFPLAYGGTPSVFLKPCVPMYFWFSPTRYHKF